MSVAYQTSVWLGPCGTCGARFYVDRDWWFARYDEGLPPLEQCKGCHPVAHHGAPVPAPPDSLKDSVE